MSGSMDPAVLQSFLGEVREYLPALEHEVEAVREGGPEADTFNEIHRLAHSIRSASEMIGLAHLAAAARGVEKLVAPVALYDEAFDPNSLEALLDGVAAMREGMDVPEAAQDADEEVDLDPPADLLAAALATPLEVAETGAVEIPDIDPVAEDLVDTFLGEAEQLLDNLGNSLDRLRAQPENLDAVLLDLRHNAHTLKGAAGMVGMDTTSLVAHRMEDILDLLCSGVLPPEPEVLDLLDSSCDCLTDLVTARGHNQEVRPRVIELLESHAALMALVNDATAGGSAPATETQEEEIVEIEDVDSFLLDTFLEEAETHLAAAGDALRQLSGNPTDPAPALLQFRRAVHTIKGAAGMVGLNTTSQLAKRLQFLLDRIDDGVRRYNAAIFEVLSSGFDLLSDLIASPGENTNHLPRLREAFATLDALLAGRDDAVASSELPPSPQEADQEAPAKAEAPAAAAPIAQHAGPPPAEEAQQTVRVPLERLSNVGRIIGEIFLNASTVEQQIGSFRHDLDELALNLARMRRISSALAEVQSEESASGTAVTDPRPEMTGAASEFDVLEFDRYTRLYLLSRDLAEATSDLSALSTQLQTMRSQFDAWIGRQRGLSGEAQDKLMRLRMVPLSTLSNRLDRTVRVSANKTGKTALLSIEGAETQFDKSVVEQLSAPLEHLLRNAVDHGIEPPAYRTAIGKPQIGQIRLEASHHGAHIVVRLSDDGAGLDYGKIRRRAVELGWLTTEQAERLDTDSVSRLILEPGFSTSDTVSEISGRGVGMDIVRAAVEALKGRLTIHSTPGAGTTFTLLLPVSLAVARAMIVESAGSRFALPMASFTRAVRVVHSEIEIRDGKPGIDVDGKWIPVLFLANWLGLAPQRARDPRMTLLFIDNGDQEIALAVDRVVEAREVVVKPLTGLLHRLNRFSGATILGDGSVVLIVNSSALDPEPANAAPMTMPVRTAAPTEDVDVLIVDDSLSIRRSVSNLIRSVGWRVTPARDGVEALEVLQAAVRRPDVILMDIEMPRMDGYELASRLRSQSTFNGVPIIMLTSRAGEKHRLKAASIGVDGYLVKPCPDDLLLAEVRRRLGSKTRSSQAAS